ncbi:uncharacterized protein MELLADRAFT_87072 [Melampsora larici-populina 98AG31]|uniref:CxC1-like cysteine cluster associated with KDZ transposases domain-containing protein n=1 Tax=Melampsora larici-populina (strain 98AG31 / pathotype 3-4-7) TaxID=747676 RepID=F4R4F0_MELLP|nr:uncharacterized protein MELLADRAFT_87072 [Melampsora larici-populina 98AG31]EGG12800.1 hypothetical protein MELLADRAFT_87072 [Melampsora larici-populina 98AG31]
MPLPGENIPMPQKRAKKPTTKKGSVATQRFAALQAKEDEAARKAIAALNRPAPDQPVEQPVDPNAYVYDALTRDDGNDPARSSDGEGNENPVNRAEYYRSTTYQERALREEAHWAAVLPKVFPAFMICSRQTYQWCDRVSWNQDWNRDCRCKDWQRRTVEVDTIDLTIRLGYMGSKPILPRTAFSIRLLRFHHTLWKNSSVRIAAFTETMDEYLDPRNSLFQVPGTDQTRHLRRCFSAAVDAYREMLRMEEEMVSSALRLTPMDELAAKCPSCLGPNVPGKRPDEPDPIACLDANFQQRRHLMASAAWRGESRVIPSIFLSPAQVLTWKVKMGPVNQRVNTS